MKTLPKHPSEGGNRRPFGWRAMRGVAAVEFALVLIPMTLMVFGVTEYGQAIYQYNALVKSVRDATRLLTMSNPADVTVYPAADAKCLAVYGNTACSGPVLVPGLTTAMVVICNPVDSSGCPGKQYANVATPNGDVINLVEVRITGYTFNFVFNPVVLLTSGAPAGLTFGGISNTMRQIL